MKQSTYRILFIITRYFHMLTIAFLNIIFGFVFAILNSYLFPSTASTIEKYEKEDGTISELIYIEIIGYIILEICIIVLEIYLIRNIVKYIGSMLSNSYIFTKDLSYVFYKEYSSNIMIGYIIYLFSFELNERFSFLITQINSNAMDPLEKNVYELQDEVANIKDRINIQNS